MTCSLEGRGEQICERSWYMHPDLYVGSANDHGHWNEMAEQHFLMLDNLFLDGGRLVSSPSDRKLVRQPHKQSQWRNFARNSTPLRKCRINLEQEAEKIIV